MNLSFFPISKPQDSVQDSTNTDTNSNSENTSTTSDNNYVLIHFAIVLTVIIIAIIICTMLYIYRKKLPSPKFECLKKSRDSKGIVEITHIRNVNNNEFDTLEYYSNDYIANNSRHVLSYPELPPSNVSHISENSDNSDTPDVPKRNRNYKIYAKNENSVGKDNVKVNQGVRNIGTVENDSTENTRVNNNSVTRNINGSIGFKSIKSHFFKTQPQISRITSPVIGSSTSIYNNETANTLVRNLSANVASPVPSVSPNNHNQPKEIQRVSQSTLVSNAKSSVISNDSLASSVYSPPIISQNISTDLPNLPVVPSSPLDKSGSSTKFFDSLGLFKAPNNESTGFESKKDKKNETTTKEDFEQEEEKSYLRLSRESNLFKKTLYRIT